MFDLLYRKLEQFLRCFPHLGVLVSREGEAQVFEAQRIVLVIAVLLFHRLKCPHFSQWTVDLELMATCQPRDGTLAATNLPAREATAPNLPPAAKQGSEPERNQTPDFDGAVFARNLKSLLFEKSLSLQKLAHLSGICKPDIYQYAKEQRDVATPALARIAQVLQVGEAELLNPARNNVIVVPTKVMANLKAILAHHGCSLLTYAKRLAMGCGCISQLVETGDISTERAHKIAAAERISVRQLVSEDVSHLFPPRPQMDSAVLSRNLRSLCWEKGLSPNEIALKAGVIAQVALRYFNGKTTRPCHDVLNRIGESFAFCQPLGSTG